MNIPSDEKLDAMCKEIDEDENGVIDYNELCGLIRNLGVVRTIDVAQVLDSAGAWLVRGCLRSADVVQAGEPRSHLAPNPCLTRTPTRRRPAIRSAPRFART